MTETIPDQPASATAAEIAARDAEIAALRAQLTAAEADAGATIRAALDGPTR